MIVQGKVDQADGKLKFTFAEYYPIARTKTWTAAVDQSDGQLKVWDDRDYVAGWPLWRDVHINQTTNKAQVIVPRYEPLSGSKGNYSGFHADGPYWPPPDPDPGSVRYAHVQSEAYDDFLAKTTRVNEDDFKHGDTAGVNGVCRCWYRGGYKNYYIPAAAKSGTVLKIHLLVAGKHYYRIWDTPLLKARVDSGQVTFDWNEGPYDMYTSGLDFVTDHVPDLTVSMTDFNDTWAAGSSDWDQGPASDSYRIFDLPTTVITGMTGNVLYLWYLFSNTAFPWRDNALNTAEDLGLFFGGSLWVLY